MKRQRTSEGKEAERCSPGAAAKPPWFAHSQAALGPSARTPRELFPADTPSGQRYRAGCGGSHPGSRCPARQGRGGRYGNRSPGEATRGEGRSGRCRCPRRALTQHEGAEAPGHALGQVVHIELHGVQGQRLLHGGAGAAAGRHPEPWQTPAGRREAEGNGGSKCRARRSSRARRHRP